MTEEEIIEEEKIPEGMVEVEVDPNDYYDFYKLKELNYFTPEVLYRDEKARELEIQQETDSMRTLFLIIVLTAALSGFFLALYFALIGRKAKAVWAAMVGFMLWMFVITIPTIIGIAFTLPPLIQTYGNISESAELSIKELESIEIKKQIARAKREGKI